MAINFDLDEEEDETQTLPQIPILIEHILINLVENWGFVDGGDLIGIGRSAEFSRTDGTTVYFEECLEDNPIVKIPSGEQGFRNNRYWHTVSYQDIWDDSLDTQHSWLINVSFFNSNMFITFNFIFVGKYRNSRYWDSRS